MSDREKKIAEIREALEKATPRWHYNGNEIVSLDNPRVGIGGFLRDENNYLAANAPEWLRFLLSELERMEREHAEERAAHNAQDGVNKLLQERQKLIEGLLTIMNIASEDGVHWKLDRCYTTARDILKEVGVTVE